MCACIGVCVGISIGVYVCDGCVGVWVHGRASMHVLCTAVCTPLKLVSLHCIQPSVS